MGVIDTIDGLRGKKRRGSPIAVITSMGKSKLEKPGVPEYQWRVLNILNENGPSSVNDISKDTGLSETRVKSICKQLESDGFIKRASQGE